MRVIKSFSKVASANAISRAITFFLIALLARELTTQGLGSYFLFQALVGVLAMVSDLGLRGAAEKRISEARDAGFLTTAILLKIVILVPLSLIIFLFSDIINQYVGSDITYILILTIIAREGHQLFLQVLNAERRTSLSSILEASQKLTWLFIVVIVVKFEGSLQSILLSQVFSYSFLGLLELFLISTPITKTISWEKVTSLYNYAIYDIIAGVGSKIFSWGDILIIGFFLSQSAVSGYELAWKVSTVTLFFGAAITRVIFPEISHMSNGKEDGIIQLVNKSLKISLLLIIPIAFGVSLLSSEILSILFGSQYETARNILIVFMIMKVFESIDQIVSQLLQGIDRPDIVAKSGILALVVNISLNVIFVNIFGVIGCAFATTISIILVMILRYRAALDLLNWNQISIRFPLSLIINSVVMGGFIVVVKDYVTIKGAPGLIAIIMISGLVYFVASLSNPWSGNVIAGLIKNLHDRNY